MEAFEHHVVFIFNLQSLVTIALWLFWSITTSTAFWCFSNNIITIFIFWSYDQQHQKYHHQHFDLSIINIFNTLSFQSATTSATYLVFWHFDLQHLQHFDLSISNIFSNNFSILIFWSATTSATSSVPWPFNQQHLQHFDLSISNIFRSATSSVLWPFD